MSHYVLIQFSAVRCVQSTTLSYYAGFLFASGLAGFALSGFHSKAKSSLIVGQRSSHSQAD